MFGGRRVRLLGLLYFCAVCATRRWIVERGVRPFPFGPSSRPELSWGQPDPGNAGEGGKQPRQCRDVPVLPDGAGPASKARGVTKVNQWLEPRNEVLAPGRDN